ncbi:hypothetical protein LJC49_05475 [Ruminococcaceae bacterium OttesenSCG-928-I18]|nr:hypothetical protein [Ruminococcaceae bacterium OttesenSCG-928-I18]
MKNIFHPAAFLPNGEIDRQRVDRAAYKAMAPLVEGISAAIKPPAPAMEWLRHTVNALYNMGHPTEFSDAIKLLYALARQAAPPDMEPYLCHPTAANYFILSCLAVVENMTEEPGPASVD